MDHIMFKPKLNTHLFRFNQLVEIEHWNSWQVFFWNAGETPSNQEPTLEVSSDVMLKVDQNGTSQKISPFWIRLCTKVMKIHSFQRRFRLVCSPPPVGIEGWWANVPTSFHQNESRLNRKITHLRPVRFNVLFLLVNLHCRQHDVFFFQPTCILHSKYYHLGRIHDLFFQTTEFFGNVASGNSCIQTSIFPVLFELLFQLFVDKSDPKYWSNINYCSVLFPVQQMLFQPQVRKEDFFRHSDYRIHVYHLLY